LRKFPREGLVVKFFTIDLELTPNDTIEKKLPRVVQEKSKVVKILNQ
jgi:hypothetical protein